MRAEPRHAYPSEATTRTRFLFAVALLCLAVITYIAMTQFTLDYGQEAPVLTIIGCGLSSFGILLYLLLHYWDRP